MEEIFDYVLWEVRRSGYERKLIAGIVLTGGGSLMRHINLLAEYHTGLTARVGEPIEHLAHGYEAMLASPIYATAIGLLIHAIENETAKLNPTKEEEGMDLEGDGSGGEMGEHGKKWYKKLFTYTREFFEATPDSEF